MGERFNIINFLKSAVAAEASDEHLMVGHSPYVRKNGFIKKTSIDQLSREDLENSIIEISPTSIKNTILEITDLDFMYEIEGCSRFRVNYNRQMGQPALVIRNIPYGIPTLKDLVSLSDLGITGGYEDGSCQQSYCIGADWTALRTALHLAQIRVKDSADFPWASTYKSTHSFFVSTSSYGESPYVSGGMPRERELPAVCR